MIDDLDIERAAYQSERSSSRRLAASSGISMAAALRQTLATKAGDAGLAQLLADRSALTAAQQERSAARVARKVLQKNAHHARHTATGTPWRAWFDGSARPNPGRCGIGALLCGPHGERIEISQDAGHGNSSEAEYLALIAVLETAVQAGAHGLAVHGDSRVVVDDVSGAVPSPALAPYRARVLALLAQLGGSSLHWVPRHKNALADALSQRP